MKCYVNTKEGVVKADEKTCVAPNDKSCVKEEKEKSKAEPPILGHDT